MNLSSSLKYVSLLTCLVFTVVTGKAVKANNPPEKNQVNSNLAHNSINQNNFRQLTSASNLNLTSEENQSKATQQTVPQVAQTDIEIDPGSTTRSGSSYIGLGGNIGLDGETTIGQGSFAVISKIGLNDYLSFRPTALVEEDATFLLPLTVDFYGKEVAETDFRIAPYLGGGLSLATGEDDTVGVVVTGGLDIPLSSKFTANTAVNVKFIDSTDVGILLGVGYNL